MDNTQLEKLRAKLVALVPIDGTAIGNGFLRENIRLTPEDYQIVVDALVDNGILERWRGRGGTLRRTTLAIETPAKTKPTPEDDKVEKETLARSRILETKLYPPFLANLQLWAKDQGWLQHVVNQLAFQGRRSTGGTWTRPDFIAIGYRRFDYTPGIVRDIVTFEVKPSACGVEAVFETAAHSRVATKSYLAIHTPDDGSSTIDLDRIEAECVRFGVGLILFPDGAKYDGWQFRVEPNRQEPDPFNVDEFVSAQVPLADQAKIRQWVR